MKLFLILDDLLFFAGAICLSIAAYQIDPVFGLAVTGFLLMISGILIGLANRGRDDIK